MEIVVIGGGWYGSYHTRQLLKASDRNRLEVDRLLVVDRDPSCPAASEFWGHPKVELVTRDWRSFLLNYLNDGAGAWDAHLVPAPFTPHLAYLWLKDSLTLGCPWIRVEQGACDGGLGLPYEHADEEGNLYISQADWLCPVTCIEPEICPVVKAHKDWELGNAVRRYVVSPQSVFSSAEVFVCHHLAFGIGTIPLNTWLEARERIIQASKVVSQQQIAVATVSSCHGVMSALRVTSLQPRTGGCRGDC